jgi:hypothetical protein
MDIPCEEITCSCEEIVFSYNIVLGLVIGYFLYDQYKENTKLVQAKKESETLKETMIRVLDKVILRSMKNGYGSNEDDSD